MNSSTLHFPHQNFIYLVVVNKRKDPECAILYRNYATNNELEQEKAGFFQGHLTEKKSRDCMKTMRACANELDIIRPPMD